MTTSVKSVKQKNKTADTHNPKDNRIDMVSSHKISHTILDSANNGTTDKKDTNGDNSKGE